jgi:hypothetical protein
LLPQAGAETEGRSDLREIAFAFALRAESAISHEQSDFPARAYAAVLLECGCLALELPTPLIPRNRMNEWQGILVIP